MNDLPMSEVSKTNAELDEWRIGHIMVWRFELTGGRLTHVSEWRRTTRGEYDDCEYLNGLCADITQMTREYYALLKRLQQNGKLHPKVSKYQVLKQERLFKEAVRPGVPLFTVPTDWGSTFVADDKGQRFFYFEDDLVFSSTGEQDYVTLAKLRQLQSAVSETVKVLTRMGF